MKRWHLTTIAILTALAMASGVCTTEADEKAPAAPPPAAAQKDDAGKAMEGCKADGSCCAAGTCQAQGETAGAKDAGGGCPCQRAKRMQQQQTTQE